MRALLLLLALAPGALAQTAEDNRPQAGQWSLLFGTGPDFQLTALESGTISAKYHQTPRRALRFTLGVNASAQDGSQRFDETFIPGSEQNESGTEGERTDYGTSVTSEVLWYGSLADPVAFYAGGGPRLFYGRSQSESTETETRQFDSNNPVFEQTVDVSRESTTWSAGALGVVGAEWFVASRVSLTAEYTVVAGYTHSDREETREAVSQSENALVNVTTDDDSGWILNRPTARLGIALYF